MATKLFLGLTILGALLALTTAEPTGGHKGGHPRLEAIKDKLHAHGHGQHEGAKEGAAGGEPPKEPEGGARRRRAAGIAESDTKVEVHHKGPAMKGLPPPPPIGPHGLPLLPGHGPHPAKSSEEEEKEVEPDEKAVEKRGAEDDGKPHEHGKHGRHHPPSEGASLREKRSLPETKVKGKHGEPMEGAAVEGSVRAKREEPKGGKHHGRHGGEEPKLEGGA